MSTTYTVHGSGRQHGAALKSMIHGIQGGSLGSFNAATPMKSIMGAEAHQTDYQMKEVDAASGNRSQKAALAVAVAAAGSSDFKDRAKKLGDMMRLSGLESFSQQLDPGALNRQKAATIQLNNTDKRQWAAPEEMYPTVYIPYNEEVLILPVDVAGVGAYNMSGNVNEAFEDLRPIAAVLADSKFNPGDDLRLVPVLPTDNTNPNFGSFVQESVWPSWNHSYGVNDLLGREAHKTNFLAIKKANNLMALCQAPGSKKFTNTDEIEAGSIAINALLLGLKSKDQTDVAYFKLDTRTMAARSMRPSTNVTADDKRQLSFPINGLDVKNLKDKLGAPTKAFQSLEAAGLTVYVAFEFTATYHRSTRSWAPTIGPVSIAYVIDANGVKMVPGTPSVPADIAALLEAQAFVGHIEGVDMYMNHNNVDRSHYGTTVVMANTTKPYGVHRRTPISVRYPMSPDDTNADVLSLLVQNMNMMVTRNMSHDAMRAARGHFDFLYDNNGTKIVSVNDDSASILPGQHFLNITAIKGEVDLLNEVSTLDTKDTRDNIEALLVNKLYDVFTALRVNSNIAALKELDGRDEEYVVVAHSSLAPFLMTTGDIRTFGVNIKFSVIETNIDSEIGNMWVFAKSKTTDSTIDIYGGMGICVAKELLLIEGEVNQANGQFRMVISQPTYLHHSLCPVAGKVVVKDMDKLLSDKGLITSINEHRAKISGEVTTTAGTGTTADGKEVDIEIGG